MDISARVESLYWNLITNDMATTKKIIGKVPVYRGEFVLGKPYYKHNIVTMLGSSFISLVDGNVNIPCSVVNASFVLGEGWSFLADASYSYLKSLKEVDIPQEEFDDMMSAGTLDITKDYYTYEEE